MLVHGDIISRLTARFVALQCMTIHYFVKRSWGRKSMSKSVTHTIHIINLPSNNDGSTVYGTDCLIDSIEFYAVSAIFQTTKRTVNFTSNCDHFIHSKLTLVYLFILLLLLILNLHGTCKYTI